MVQLFWFVPRGQVYMVQYAQLEQPTQPAITTVASQFQTSPGGGLNDPFVLPVGMSQEAAAPGRRCTLVLLLAALGMACSLS